MSEKNSRRWILVTVTAMALSFILAVLYRGFSMTAVTLSLSLTLIVGMVFLGARVIYVVLKERKEGVMISDERTLVVDGKAAKGTFIVSVYFIMALTWYDLVAQFVHLPSPKGYMYLIVTAIFLIFSFFSFRRYYGKKPTR